MIPKFRAWDTFDEDMVNDIFFSWQDCGYESLNECLSDERWKFMQSTGLFDINDKEIFEGDIVRISMRIGKRTTTSIGAVEFDKIDVCFEIRNERGVHCVTMFHARYFEVIGNIYQNPELIEVK